MAIPVPLKRPLLLTPIAIGAHLWLQCVSCVVASAACVIAKKCSVLFLISLHLLCTGMDEARALVHALCSYSVSPVSSALLHASLLINVVFCS